MDELAPVLAGLLGKISDPVVITLLVLLFVSEWRNWAQGKEERADRKMLVDALGNITNKLNESLQQIKNAISAMTGRPMP